MATQPLKTRPQAFVYRRFSVQVVDGPDAGKAITSDGPEISIGTAEGNQLVLTDRTVSGHHCVIAAAAKGYLLTDLGSTNGTLLANCSVPNAYLASGTTFTIGASQLRFERLKETAREPLSRADHWKRLLGTGVAMGRLFAQLEKVSLTDTTVLLTGDTGTGKTLVAESIHEASPRAGKPFVTIDAASLTPTLLESELFGHERGAFTGATESRQGAFESAQGGTVFLDEIGELPLEMQPKLLRVLEQRKVRRVGGTRDFALDVRIIAATHRDLRLAINAGTFREDLFYRLNVVSLQVPSLRDRREDLPLLVDHFYGHFAGTEHASAPPELVDAFSRYDWPGNVRQLRHAVERAVLLGDWDLPSARESSSGKRGTEKPSETAPASWEATFDPALPFRVAKENAVKLWTTRWVQQLLDAHKGNLTHAARAAKMDRTHLRELAVRVGLSQPDDG